MLRRAASDISAAVGGYVAGALGQATIAGVTSFIVLSILGVPYAAALALIIALLDLVPLVGATLGAIVVGVVTLFNDFPTDTIIWVVWSIVYQQIENTVIQPRIQSRTVNVQPIVVLIAVLFGVDAVRRARRPARDPVRGGDPDLHPRVPRTTGRPCAHRARRSSPTSRPAPAAAPA